MAVQQIVSYGTCQVFVSTSVVFFRHPKQMLGKRMHASVLSIGDPVISLKSGWQPALPGRNVR